MRIVFSRKGFDSSAGKAPSPVLDGQPISLPIPTNHRSQTTYDMLGLGSIVEEATKNRISRSHLCHEDPMFADSVCAFGQTGAAQTHLKNQGVTIGDVFLFFGLFADQKTNEKHHRIFGFLKVEEVCGLGQYPRFGDSPPYFKRRHPHTIGKWNANNTLYLGEGAVSRFATENLRLTQKGGPASRWEVPPWLRDYGLSYHANKERWKAVSFLNLVARGQEFVSDIGHDRVPKLWLENILREIVK